MNSQYAPLSVRNYQSDEDYWRIRQFLGEVFLLNDRREDAWQAYRFDYWRWHGVENLGQGPLEEKVFLWETQAGELAAVLNAEGHGDAFLQVHPAWQSIDLLERMVDKAEERLEDKQAGKRNLVVWASERDEFLKTILAGRGYRKPEGGFEMQRRLPLYQQRRRDGGSIEKRTPSRPPPFSGFWKMEEEFDHSLPISAMSSSTKWGGWGGAGEERSYTIRSLGGPDELPARSWASWRGFHPDEPDEEYQDWEWYLNIQRAPLYQRDLDLVAVAPGGEIAALCTVWFDDVTRTGAFEPVACVPEHQRRGLASAVMAEGLRRLQNLGATLATVGSYSTHAHDLYESMGFTDVSIAEPLRTGSI